MVIFLFIAVSPIVCGLIARMSTKPNLDKGFLIINFGLMALVYILRDKSVGTDTNNYIQMFYDISALPFQKLNSYYWGSGKVELGFCLFIKIISIFTDNYYVYFLISGIIIFSCFMYFIYDNSKNVFISTYLFICCFYTDIFNITRQYMAMGFFLCAYCFLKRRNLCKSVLLFGLALSFHASAIIYLLVYILYYIRPGKYMVLLCGAISVAIVCTYRTLIDIAILFMPRYAHFLNGIHFNPSSGNGMVQYINILIFLGCFLLCAILKLKKNIDEDQEIFFLLAMLTFATALGFITKQIVIFIRLYRYYYVFSILLIPNILERVGKYKYLIYPPLILGMGVLFFVSMQGTGVGVIPYQFGFSL